jgi:hypothetical protein
MRDDRPVRISQSANSNIPIDTAPIVMDSSLLIPPNPYSAEGTNTTRKLKSSATFSSYTTGDRRYAAPDFSREVGLDGWRSKTHMLS